MDLEELKSIWQQYDLKLDKLEKLNKKLVMETLSKKPQSKLNWLRYRTILSVIVAPVLLISVFYPYLKIENIDLKFILGWILTLSSIIYVTYINFKSFMILKGINVGEDPIIESAKKVNNYRTIVTARQKYVWITFPVLCAGVIFIAWKGFTFDIKTIFLMVVIFGFALFWGIRQNKIQQNKIDILQKEIDDLNEYKD
jgi:hypothetical protein